ncbi:hypothetical protein M758_8G102200 [Ceratodon purpureus]|nr:hypothetical protein M758_8G102200 [Ceratodon purpureus]
MRLCIESYLYVALNVVSLGVILNYLLVNRRLQGARDWYHCNMLVTVTSFCGDSLETDLFAGTHYRGWLKLGSDGLHQCLAYNFKTHKVMIQAMIGTLLLLGNPCFRKMPASCCSFEVIPCSTAISDSCFDKIKNVPFGCAKRCKKNLSLVALFLLFQLHRTVAHCTPAEMCTPKCSQYFWLAHSPILASNSVFSSF